MAPKATTSSSSSSSSSSASASGMPYIKPEPVEDAPWFSEEESAGEDAPPQKVKKEEGDDDDDDKPPALTVAAPPRRVFPLPPRPATAPIVEWSWVETPVYGYTGMWWKCTTCRDEYLCNGLRACPKCLRPRSAVGIWYSAVPLGPPPPPASSAP